MITVSKEDVKANRERAYKVASCREGKFWSLYDHQLGRLGLEYSAKEYTPSDVPCFVFKSFADAFRVALRFDSYFFRMAGYEGVRVFEVTGRPVECTERSERYRQRGWRKSLNAQSRSVGLKIDANSSYMVEVRLEKDIAGLIRGDHDQVLL